ncbi:protein kinase [Histoplasma capsulatum G186AR]|nr:protein kinase [Histoplasma capsulatum]QSS72218.1 protein kinase [Histoplasma capsulatum G186AR]
MQMACLLRWTRNKLQPNPTPRRPFASQPKALSPGRPVEEETLPDYNPEEFYPVHIGDIFNGRYQVLGKLGFGANSTVWLCRNTENRDYVALKVYIKTPTQRMNREIVAYSYLRSSRSSHAGRAHVRELLDSFELVRPNGIRHHCLVHPPLQITLWGLQRLGGKPTALPQDMVRSASRYLLQALDYLHTEVNITHCDIKLSNLMLTIEDASVLTDFEEAEQKSPCPRKVVNDERTIYTSRDFRRPRNHAWGCPVLCDFGEARVGGSYQYEEIQPEVYKAPEIIMQTDWSHSVDIWNTACVIWDMIENKHLFDAQDDEGFHNNRYHIAEMVAYLSIPPKTFQQRSPNTPLVFDEAGNWKGNPPLPPLSLEDSEKHLKGVDKIAFLSFMRSMLTWLPEERRSAKELLIDPWLNRQM